MLLTWLTYPNNSRRQQRWADLLADPPFSL
jgi:hypothetical protein